MQSLTLVRHGQATAVGANYDVLSELGQRQSQRLGAYWLARGLRFDHCVVGPRARHRDTADISLAAAGVSTIARQSHAAAAGLDEHDGLRVLKRATGNTATGDRLSAEDEPRDAMLQRVFSRYHEIMQDWAGGAYAAADIEPWASFRQRVGKTLVELSALPGHTVAFTSGGWIAAALGEVLGLDDRRVIDLSAVLVNTSVTELRWHAGVAQLACFNLAAHLSPTTEVTLI